MMTNLPQCSLIQKRTTYLRRLFLPPSLFRASECSVSVCTHRPHCACGGQRTICRTGSSSGHHARPRNRTRVIRLGNKHLTCWIISPIQMLTFKKYVSSHFSVYFQDRKRSLAYNCRHRIIK